MEASLVSNSAKGGCACLSKAALCEDHALNWGEQHWSRLDGSATAHVYARPNHNIVKVCQADFCAVQVSTRLPAAVSPAVAACLGRQMFTLPPMGLRSA